MKRINVLLAFTVIFLASPAISQVAINNSGESADQSAILDLNAQDKGLLVPRVTLVATDNFSNPVADPAVGLLIYHIGGNNILPGFFMWDGINWQSLATMASVQNVLHGPESSGIFGEIFEYHAIGAFSTIVIPSAGTYVQWSSGSQGDLGSMNVNAGGLVSNSAGMYSVSFNASFQTSTNGNTVDVALFVNGVRKDDLHSREWLKEFGKSKSVSFSGIIGLGENDTVTVGFTSDNNVTVKIETANLSLARLN